MPVPGAVRHRGDRISAAAADDQRLKEFHAGVLNSGGDIATAGANPGAVLQGILIGNPNTGADATLQHSNVSQAVIGAAVAAVNTRLVPNASGRLIPGTTGQASYFMSLSTGTTDGQMITVKLGYNGQVP